MAPPLPACGWLPVISPLSVSAGSSPRSLLHPGGRLLWLLLQQGQDQSLPLHHRAQVERGEEEQRRRGQRPLLEPLHITTHENCVLRRPLPSLNRHYTVLLWRLNPE